MYEKGYYNSGHDGYEGGYGTIFEKVADEALYAGLEGINANLEGIYELLLNLLAVVQTKAEKAAGGKKEAGFKMGLTAGEQKKKEDLIAKMFGNA
ncbi:MAG: hypothetical protein FWE21_10340 [Defluviitaleaceae bacterium]|nr:hypothetical protein [Defluviitaleaceae bacterium]